MKGLSLEAIVFLILGIVGLSIFFSLLGLFRTASNWIYCNMFLRIKSFFFGEHVSIPEICKEYKKPYVKIVEFREGELTNEIFSRKLLALIISCWKLSEVRGLYKSQPCFRVRIFGMVENVSEWNVSKILIKEDKCVSIENSDYGCGKWNQILWNIDGKIRKDIGVNELKDEIVKILNQIIHPSLSPKLTPNMFELDTVSRKLQLKMKLSSTIPSQICNNYQRCYYYEHDKSKNVVTLNISMVNHTYDIDLALSLLEKEGVISSTITDQTILFIEYNGFKDAVEITG